MALDNPNLASLTEADLQELITNAVPEGRDLDYKVSTYGPTDDNRREFLADVSSFANTIGGHLVIGMEEKGGVATALPGVDLDPDAEIRRLDSLARDGLQPRLLTIKFHFIRLANKRVAIIVRVPKSWDAPHRVIAQKSNRFWARGAGGKYEPDVSELRNLFAVAPSLADSIRNFRMDRLVKIAAGDTPVPIMGDGALVLHVVPFDAFGAPTKSSIDELWTVQEHCRPMAAMGYSPRVNLDGLLLTTGSDSSARPAYVQVWRDGRFESVRAPLVRVLEERNNQRVVFSTTVEKNLIEGTGTYILGLEALNVPPPYAVLIGLIGTGGATLDIMNSDDYRTNPFDRDLVAVSDLVWNDSPTLAKNLQVVAKFLRPALDEIANSAGRFGSRNFDATGEWKPRQN